MTRHANTNTNTRMSPRKWCVPSTGVTSEKPCTVSMYMCGVKKRTTLMRNAMWVLWGIHAQKLVYLIGGWEQIGNLHDLLCNSLGLNIFKSGSVQPNEIYVTDLTHSSLLGYRQTFSNPRGKKMSFFCTKKNMVLGLCTCSHLKYWVNYWCFDRKRKHASLTGGRMFKNNFIFK